MCRWNNPPDLPGKPIDNTWFWVIISKENNGREKEEYILVFPQRRELRG